MTMASTVRETGANRRIQQHALDWAHRFARYVRTRDYTAGRNLFAQDVQSYGTRTVQAEGLDQLHDQQWSPTWARTEGFDYVPDSLQVRVSEDASMAVVLARWHSVGVDDPGRWGSQTPYPRSGRCTLVLLRQEDGDLVCIHSHFSMNPEPACPA